MTTTLVDLHLRSALTWASAICFLVCGDGVAVAQAAQPAADAACFPACRSAFLCSKGQCVSRCNPVCGADETCTAAGECASARATSTLAAPIAPARTSAVPVPAAAPSSSS